MTDYPVHEVHHLPDPQTYAVDQERMRHDGALWAFGEYAMFILFWNITDHERGLVARCSKCYAAYGKIAEAYGQPAVNECSRCFGTSFEGGYKAKIVRPSLWDFNLEDYKDSPRGEVLVASASVQTTADFRMRTGDVIVRADNVRWRMRSTGTNHLRTGFELPTGDRSALGYNYGQVIREDEDSVVYTIPPGPAEIRSSLDVVGTRYPKDFATLEVVRGPLL